MSSDKIILLYYSLIMNFIYNYYTSMTNYNDWQTFNDKVKNNTPKQIKIIIYKSENDDAVLFDEEEDMKLMEIQKNSIIHNEIKFGNSDNCQLLFDENDIIT